MTISSPDLWDKNLDFGEENIQKYVTENFRLENTGHIPNCDK